MVCREPTSAPITFSFTEEALREISVGATLVDWGSAGVLDEPPPPQEDNKTKESNATLSCTPVHVFIFTPNAEPNVL